MTEISINLRIELPDEFLAAFRLIAAGFAAGAAPPDRPVAVPPPAAADMPQMSELPVAAAPKVDAKPAVADVAPETAMRRGPKATVWPDARCLRLVDLRRRKMTWEAILDELNADKELPKIASVGALQAKYKALREDGVVQDSDMVGRGAHLDKLKTPPVPPVETESKPEPPPAIVTLQEPGPHVAESSLATELRRALEAKRAATPPAATPVTPRGKAEPLEVSMEQAITWASQRGLANGSGLLDIGKVNAKRVQLGLAEFIIKPSLRSRISA